MTIAKRGKGKRIKGRPVMAWGGFVSGTLDSNNANDGYGTPGRSCAIYLTRKAARARYQDVRRVLIVEDTP